MTHGAVLICVTGTCSLTLPIKPALISTGNPIRLKAPSFSGKFSSSTAPKRVKRLIFIKQTYAAVFIPKITNNVV